jgi:hypothetical protein
MADRVVTWEPGDLAVYHPFGGETRGLLRVERYPAGESGADRYRVVATVVGRRPRGWGERGTADVAELHRPTEDELLQFLEEELTR